MTQPGSWPQPREYQEAIQAPGICFSDPRLKNASIHLNPMGIPQAVAGKSAVVFKATAEGKDVAIRCFTRAASDQSLRYRALHAHLEYPPWYMVDFGYRDREILVANTRYPLVEMDWVDGDPLDQWVSRHLQQNGDLARQASAWLAIVDDMLQRRMAHGDIANDNCMVSRSQLKLVDYDGCYIPGLADKNPGETGAQHFQHPKRAGYYAGNMDAFPSLVIYLSLAALHADPSLWERYHKDKNLIFHSDDYKAPEGTPIWGELAQSPDTRVQSLAVALARMCREPVSRLPSLPEVMAGEPPWWEQVDLRGADGGTREAPASPEPQTPPPASNDWLRDWLRDQVPAEPRPPEPTWQEPAPVRPSRPEQPPTRTGWPVQPPTRTGRTGWPVQPPTRTPPKKPARAKTVGITVAIIVALLLVLGIVIAMVGH